MPTGQPYLNALLGALWAGLTPTTLLPPVAGAEGASRREIDHIVDAFKPNAIVGAEYGSDKVRQIATDWFRGDGVMLPDVPDYTSLRSLSYVQYTSGSTGKPRGLALHWAAIAANIETIASATGMPHGQRVVSWLPMYHDMGIFGGLLSTLHAGCPLVLMDPSLFIANPLTWLNVIHAQRATITVTPPSALSVCLYLLRRRPRRNLDLSCLKQVLCGAEPIPRGLVQDFRETFEPYGVSATALRPVYGLAEATLAVNFTPLGRGARVDHVDQEKFETADVAMPARDRGDAVLSWVSAGESLPGVAIRISDAHGAPLPERRVGQIWVKSSSLYHAALDDGRFHARSGEWLDTGDLGYLAEGELYITGRIKDLIIKNGRNYSPERLEQLARRVEGVRRCAALGIFDEVKSTERIVLLLETATRCLEDAQMRDRLRLAVRGEFAATGCHVDEIRLLPKNTLPYTTSGKLRRQQCRETYFAQSPEGVACSSDTPQTTAPVKPLDL